MLAVNLILAYVVAACVFSGAFYQGLGMGFSELLVLLSSAFYAKVIRRQLVSGEYPFLKYLFFLVVLLTIYLMMSLLFQSDLYFVFRQGVVIVYLLSFFLFFAVLEKRSIVDDFSEKKIFFIIALASLHFPLTSFSFFTNGVRDGYALLLICASFILNLKGKQYFSLGVLLIAALTTKHFSYIVACLTCALATFFFKYNGRQWLFLSMYVGLFSTFGVLYFYWGNIVANLADANGSWRLIYWKNVWDDIFSSWCGMFGVGFGRPYIREEFADYNLILNQIEYGRGYHYQGFTTPPHNGFVNILNYSGVLGAGLFTAFFFEIFRALYKRQNLGAIGYFFSVIVVINSQNIIEQPFTAMPTFLLLAMICRYRNKLLD